MFSVILGIDSLKNSQYSDDTTLFVESVNDLQYIMNEINDFGDYAGPKINWNKTEVMKLNIVEDFVHDNAIIYILINLLNIYEYTVRPEKNYTLLKWLPNRKIYDYRGKALYVWKAHKLSFCMRPKSPKINHA